MTESEEWWRNFRCVQEEPGDDCPVRAELTILWVQAQKAAGPDSLPPDRRCALEATPGWSWDPSPAESEWCMRELLDQHILAHGRLPAASVVSAGVPLGRWLAGRPRAPRGLPARFRGRGPAP